MNSALVIGGAGFVGSNLVQRLVSKGVSVTSLDNYSTGRTHRHIEGCLYFAGEARDITGIGHCFERPDVVFHLGEYSRVEQSVDEPVAAMRGTDAVPMVMEFCKTNASKLVYTGSSTRFGDAASPYSVCKAKNAQMVEEMRKFLGIEAAVVYLYNVYGPGELRDGLYSTLIGRALRAKETGECIQVTAPGTQRRNFTHVEDVVDGLLAVAQKGDGDGYGIGADDDYSVLDVVKMIGCQYRIGFRAKGNRMSASLTTEATKALGWRAQRDLQSYIEEEINA